MSHRHKKTLNCQNFVFRSIFDALKHGKKISESRTFRKA